MIIQITRYELELIEKEYELSLKSNLSDDDDLFVPIKDVGMCKVRKGAMRELIDSANIKFSKGNRLAEINVEIY